MAEHLIETYLPPRAARTGFEGEGLQEEGFGLSLSGGGFKAAAYHIGGLVRLNELGMLRQIRRLASVSGGSITSGQLASKWSALNWTSDKSDAVATNFMKEVAAPLHEFLTECNIDAPQGALGLLLPFRSAADGVAGAYKKHLLHDATLQSLPDAEPGKAPEFAFLATSYQLNNMWAFTKAKASNYRIGKILAPDFELARIVAASSAFPPFFCPLKLDFKGQTVIKTDLADKHEDPYLGSAELCDGGIYDNMGLEPTFKSFRNLLVSNAGDPFNDDDSPPDNWYSLMRRIISMMHRQAENNRIRWLMDLVERKERNLGLWPLRTHYRRYDKPSNLRLDPDDTENDRLIRKAQTEEVRLWSLSEGGFKRLANYGYILADSALQTYFGKPAATALPFP
jgi:NTE family protein